MATHKLKGGSRERVCDQCGRIDHVRTDSRSTTCRSCSSKAKGIRAGESRRSRSHRITCGHCGKTVRRSRTQAERASVSYCSRGCRSSAARVDRTCKQCGSNFSVLKSAIGEGTNASGNFCSRTCYDRWLCQTDRVKGRGSRWRAIRREAIRRNPFCALCGNIDKSVLQVHHIAPYRLTHDNSPENLIPLCVKHHKRVETLTHEAEAAGSDPDTIKLIFGSMLREHQSATRMKLKELMEKVANDNQSRKVCHAAQR